MFLLYSARLRSDSCKVKVSAYPLMHAYFTIVKKNQGTMHVVCRRNALISVLIAHPCNYATHMQMFMHDIFDNSNQKPLPTQSHRLGTLN